MKWFYLIAVYALIIALAGCVSNHPSELNSRSTNQSNQINKQVQDAAVAEKTDSSKLQPKFSPASAVSIISTKAEIKPGGSGEAIIDLKIIEPFHVNSNPPSEKNFIPLEVNFENSADITTGKPIYPRGVPKTFAFSDKPLSVYQNEISIKLPLKASLKIVKGQQTLNGQLKFQPCDEEVCYRPQQIDVALPVAINQ